MKADRNPGQADEDDVPPNHPFAGAGPSRGQGHDPHQEAGTENDAMKRLLKQFHELREDFAYCLAAKADGIKLSVRESLLHVAWSLLGWVALSGLILAASWIVLSGAAEGLGLLLGGRPWAGKVVTGLLLLSGVGICMRCVSASRKAASLERTVEKYEQRNARQKAEFGRDVFDQAAATAENK